MQASFPFATDFIIPGKAAVESKNQQQSTASNRSCSSSGQLNRLPFEEDCNNTNLDTAIVNNKTVTKPTNNPTPLLPSSAPLLHQPNTCSSLEQTMEVLGELFQVQTSSRGEDPTTKAASGPSSHQGRTNGYSPETIDRALSLFAETIHKEPYYVGSKDESQKESSGATVHVESLGQSPRPTNLALEKALSLFDETIFKDANPTNENKEEERLSPRIQEHGPSPQTKAVEQALFLFGQTIHQQPYYNDHAGESKEESQPSREQTNAKDLMIDRALSLFSETIHKQSYYKESSENNKPDKTSVPSSPHQVRNPKQETNNQNPQELKAIQHRNNMNNAQVSNQKTDGAGGHDAATDRALSLFGETIHKQPYYIDTKQEGPKEKELSGSAKAAGQDTYRKSAADQTIDRALSLLGETIHKQPYYKDEGNKETQESSASTPQSQSGPPKSVSEGNPSKRVTTACPPSRNQQPARKYTKMAETTRKLKPKRSDDPFSGMKCQLDLDREKAAMAKALILLEAGVMY